MSPPIGLCTLRKSIPMHKVADVIRPNIFKTTEYCLTRYFNMVFELSNNRTNCINKFNQITHSISLRNHALYIIKTAKFPIEKTHEIFNKAFDKVLEVNGCERSALNEFFLRKFTLTLRMIH